MAWHLAAKACVEPLYEIRIFLLLPCLLASHLARDFCIDTAVDLPSFHRSTQDRIGSPSRATRPKKEARKSKVRPTANPQKELFWSVLFSRVCLCLIHEPPESIHEVRNHLFLRLRHPPLVESWRSPIFTPNAGPPPKPRLPQTGARRLELFGISHRNATQLHQMRLPTSPRSLRCHPRIALRL